MKAGAIGILLFIPIHRLFSYAGIGLFYQIGFTGFVAAIAYGAFIYLVFKDVEAKLSTIAKKDHIKRGAHKEGLKVSSYSKDLFEKLLKSGDYIFE